MQLAWMGINWLAVLAGGVVCMVIGFLWYSPALFARPWMAASGYDINDKAKMDEMKKSMGKTYSLAFLAALLQAAMLAKILAVTGVWGALYGMKIAFGVWLGFVMTVQLTGALFGNQKMKLFAINTGYQLVSYLAMGALLAPMHVR
ncbi:MAG: DUF1761 domain-containing protein [Candidatus Koribacter versatilis]|uniref:DUF1761 domain-containing protein n=1 Tax=Candidatus Korobacter versatilis TaxID=658062 RepID=A0A932EPZ3_9BACT|nr:DUF1761 domain-containing protein [Candidatus Koribacter versatilis]